MKKVLSIMLSVILIATMFVGCGNLSKKETTLANYVEKEDRLFLLADCTGFYEPSKDSSILAILILKSDGTYIFSDTDKTLGELEQMEDSEIIEIAEQGYKKLMQESVDKIYAGEYSHILGIGSEEFCKDVLKSYYELCEDLLVDPAENTDYLFYSHYFGNSPNTNNKLGEKYIEIIKKNAVNYSSTKDYEKAGSNIYKELNECYESSEAYQAVKKALDDFISNPISTYKIVVNTDSTGNNVSSETLVLQNEPTLDNYNVCIRDFYSLQLTKAESYPITENVGFEIYDSTYYGYHVYNEDANNVDSYLLTRGKKVHGFTLDSIGTKNTTTDNLNEILEENKSVIFDISSYVSSKD